MSSRLRRRLSPRLALAVAGFIVAAVPVTVLGYWATHGWAPLHTVDTNVATGLHQWAVHRPGLVSVLLTVATVFHPWVLRAVTAVIVAWLLVRRQIRLAAWATVTMVVAGLLGDGLKTVVGRARPHLPNPVDSAPGASFPSGHALNSLVFAAVVLGLVLPLLRRRGAIVAWTLAVAFVVLVGFDRVALGVHYLSDVLAGWILGAGLVAVTAAAFESWRRAAGRAPRDPGDQLSAGLDPAASRSAAPIGRSH